MGPHNERLFKIGILFTLTFQSKGVTPAECWWGPLCVSCPFVMGQFQQLQIRIHKKLSPGLSDTSASVSHTTLPRDVSPLRLGVDSWSAVKWTQDGSLAMNTHTRGRMKTCGPYQCAALTLDTWPTCGLKPGHCHQREHQGAGTQLSPAARGWL